MCWLPSWRDGTADIRNFQKSKAKKKNERSFHPQKALNNSEIYSAVVSKNSSSIFIICRLLLPILRFILFSSGWPSPWGKVSQANLKNFHHLDDGYLFWYCPKFPCIHFGNLALNVETLYIVENISLVSTIEAH